MELQIKKLKMKNFKGIKSKDIEFEQGINFIRGANASGKTTVSDAIHWLLFGKDSQGRKDFEIRPLDTENNEIHFVEIEVEADFIFNGEELNLSKKMVEKWVKKRGQAAQEYSGNETNCFINEVPVKANEYADKIAAIASSEELFRLLTNPMYFNNNNVKWEERRKRLVDMVGDTDDQSLIENNTAFSGLVESMKKWTVNEYKEVLTRRIKDLKKEIENIPGRIDELQRSLSEADTDYTEIESELAKVKAREKELDAVLSSGSGAMDNWKKQKVIIDGVDNEIRFMVREIDGLEDKFIKERDQAIYAIETTLRDCIMKQNIAKHDIESLSLDKTKKLEEKQVLTKEFREIAAKPINHPVLEGNCPTCGQVMPVEMMKEQIDLLFEKANSSKAKSLKEINDKGKFLNEHIAAIDKNVEILKEELLKLEAMDKKLQAEMDNYDSVVKRDPLIKAAKEKQLSNLKENYQQLTNENFIIPGEENVEVREEKTFISHQISELSKVLGKKEYFENTEKRITELEKEEQRYQNELSHAEGQKQLVEDFIRFKVSLLEGNINKHFTLVKFKLFKEQINGGMKEICEAMVDGVPYSELNTGSKLNAGLDIIKTFSKIYRFAAPVFIDNRESVSEIMPLDTQIINLTVDPKCTTLCIN